MSLTYKEKGILANFLFALCPKKGIGWILSQTEKWELNQVPNDVVILLLSF